MIRIIFVLSSNAVNRCAIIHTADKGVNKKYQKIFFVSKIYI